MATHPCVLAQRIPGTGEPGGLPSLGLHRVGQNRSDLAAAAAWFQFLPLLAWNHLTTRVFLKQMNSSFNMVINIHLCLGEQRCVCVCMCMCLVCCTFIDRNASKDGRICWLSELQEILWGKFVSLLESQVRFRYLQMLMASKEICIEEMRSLWGHTARVRAWLPEKQTWYNSKIFTLLLCNG